MERLIGETQATSGREDAQSFRREHLDTKRCDVLREQRRISKFEIEDIEGPDQAATGDLEAALVEARERGVSRATQILAGGDMLSGSAFSKFIGIFARGCSGKAPAARSSWSQRGKARTPFSEMASDQNWGPVVPALFIALP